MTHYIFNLHNTPEFVHLHLLLMHSPLQKYFLYPWPKNYWQLAITFNDLVSF